MKTWGQYLSNKNKSHISLFFTMSNKYTQKTKGVFYVSYYLIDHP